MKKTKKGWIEDKKYNNFLKEGKKFETVTIKVKKPKDYKIWITRYDNFIIIKFDK